MRFYAFFVILLHGVNRKEGIQVSCLQEIVEKFPIRKTKKQKEAFLAWAKAQAQDMGYDARVEENGRGGAHRNLVVGDPEKAQAVFTAHYDTPAVMPFPNLMMPRNLPLFFLYQFLIVGVLIALCFIPAVGVQAALGVPFLTWLTYMILYFGLLMLMLMGPANRNNVNDNTSGVAAVLSLMAQLPPEVRDSAAFILFDNEEKGKLGSKAYAQAHPQVKKDTLIVNMDCVGVGEHMLLIGKNYARAYNDYALLQQSLAAEGGITPHFYGTAGSTCNSDQHSFRRGTVLCACRKAPVVGFYTARIHTRRDTEANEENIAYLARSLTKFVKALHEN